MIPACKFVFVFIGLLLLGCPLMYFTGGNGVISYLNQMNESTAPAFKFVLVFIAFLLPLYLPAPAPLVALPIPAFKFVLVFMAFSPFSFLDICSRTSIENQPYW